MKRTIRTFMACAALFVLLFVAGVHESQADTQEQWAAGSWSKALGGLTSTSAPPSPTSDGGYIVTGVNQPWIDDQPWPYLGTYVLKLDAFGAIVWQTKFTGLGGDPNVNNSSFHPALETADGGVLLTGRCGVGEGLSPCAIKLDSTGTVAWQAKFPATLRWRSELSDSYLINTSSTVMKLNKSTGAIIWQKELTGAAGGLHRVFPTPDGGYMAGFMGGTITKLDSAFTPVWSKLLNGDVNANNWGYYGNGNDYYVAVNYKIAFDPYYAVVHTVTIAFDGSGNILWQKYSPEENVGSHFLAADGSVAATVMSPSASHLFAVTTFSTTGTVLWSKTFEDPIQDPYYWPAIGSDGSMTMLVRQQTNNAISIVHSGPAGVLQGCNFTQEDVTFASTDFNATMTAETYPTVADGTVALSTLDFTPTYNEDITASSEGSCALVPANILAYTKAGSGAGTVTSSPGDMNCTGNCSGYFYPGTTVTLSATPANNAAFSGWGGDCAGTGTCQVTMSANHTVTGEFVAAGNQGPTAAPTGEGTYQVATPVPLGGQVADYDGDTLSYTWAVVGGSTLASGQVVTVAGGAPVDLPVVTVSGLPVGPHAVTLTVSDGVNTPVVKSLTVKIIDTMAPILTPVASKTILWPPNKNMIPITIQANASDNSGGPVHLTAAVSCNERGGRFWTTPVINQATGVITLSLQSDREGKGTGRVYTITITGTDRSGNAGIASVKVVVPHDQGKK